MTDRRAADDQSTGEARDQKRKPDLSVTQLAASGLATAVAAVGASRLGVAGTIAGAAFMSVVSTAGSVLMRHYMDRGKEQVRSLATAQAEADPAETRVDLPTLHDPAATRWDLEATRLDTAPRPAAPDRRWKVLALGAAAVFVLSIGGMMLAEAVTGKPVSSWPGGGGGQGSSLLNGSDGRPHHQSPAPSDPARTTAPTHPPSSEPPTPTPDPTTSKPQDTSTPTPATTSGNPTPPPTTPPTKAPAPGASSPAA